MKKLIVSLIVVACAAVAFAADYTPASKEVQFTQGASITATAVVLQTNTFATAFSAAPVVTCTYTEDPGDVRPIFIVSTSTTGFVCSITADKNFAYTAVGAK